MKPSFSSRKLSRQSQLFSTVAASALMVGLGGGFAHAQSALSAKITLPPGSFSGNAASGLNAYNQTGTNSGPISISPSVSGATFKNSVSKTDSQAGHGTAETLSTAANVINATAVGNNEQVLGTNALGKLASTSAGNGLAAFVGGNNAGTSSTGLAVQASATTNALTISATNPASSNGNKYLQTGNTIVANATSNNGVITLGGAVPTTYTGNAVAGATTLTPGATGSTDVISASGNIVAGTDQVNTFAGQNAGSGAVATGNSSDVNIFNTTSTASTFNDVMNNSSTVIGATFEGNASLSAVTVGGTGSAPTFDGSAVISNLQQNLSDPPTTSVPTPNAANASKNNIMTQVGLAAGAASTSTEGMSGGTLTNSNNSITASATNNSTQLPSNSTAAAGDVLTLANGQSLAGVTGTLENSASTTSAQTEADLAVSSFQNNNNAPLTVQAENNNIGAVVDNATNASVDVSGNKVTSSVAGNNASNGIEAPGGTGPSTTVSLSGTAAVNNVQSSTGSPISATTSSNGITSMLGADLPLGGSDAAQLTSNNVTQTMNGDGFGASAVNNSANNQLNAGATSVNAGAGGSPARAALSAAVSGEGNVNSSSATAGLSVNNLQNTDVNSGSSATLQNNAIAVVDETNVSGTTVGGVSGGSIGITAATEQAVAGGNLATNGLTVNATTLTGSAGIVNAQSNAGNDIAQISNVSDGQEGEGKTSDLAVFLKTDTTTKTGTVTNENVSIGGAGSAANTLEALSYNNQGNDTLTVTGANATALTSAGVSTPVTSLTLASSGVQAPSIAATYGSLVDQNSSGTSTATFSSVTGLAEAAAIPVLLKDAASLTTGSTLSVANNTIEALAFGNEEGNGGQGGNSVTVSPTSLTASVTPTTPAAAVAAALTAQTESGSVTGSITGAGGIEDLGLPANALPNGLFVVSAGNSAAASTEALASSTVQADNNSSIAQAEGNSATTTLTAASNSITATGQAGTVSGFGSLTAGSAIGAQAAYVAQTAQNSTGSISASQSSVGALVNVDGSSQNSTLEANNNNFQSLAVGNTSNTSGTIGSASATSVDTTAIASDSQIASGASITATQSGTALGVYIAGNTSADTVNVDNNLSEAQAIGNQSVTSLTAAANNIAATGQTGTISNFGSLTAGSAIEIDAAFVAQTAQNSTDSISASQSNANAHVNVGGNDTGSTLQANNNNFQSLAVGNTSNTSGTIGSASATGVDTTAIASNSQIASGASITASTGMPASMEPSAGVQVNVAGSITSGSVSVENNTSEASAIGNQGATSLTVAADTLLSGEATPGQATETASISNGALSVTGVAAPYLVANDQVASSAITSNGYGAFDINDQQGTPVITGAGLTVKDNEVNALAEGNIANNQLSLAATNSGEVSGTPILAAAGSIANVQTQSGAVAANSGSFSSGNVASYGMSVQAPVTDSNNTVALKNNVDDATALGNNANNALTFTGGSIGWSGTAAADAGISRTITDSAPPPPVEPLRQTPDLPPTPTPTETDTAKADLLAGNSQQSTAAVAAIATSQIGNNDTTSTGELSGVNVNFSSNQTNAQAINNNATNALTVAGSITSTSSGTTVTPATDVTADSLISNTQQASATATATAEQDIALSVLGTAGSASANNSQVVLNANSLQAIATNNQATNTLTETASTAGGGAGDLASINAPSNGTTDLVSAVDALFNGQISTAGASATGTSNVGATMGASGVTNTPITINANQLQVDATNNQATNTLSLTSAALDTATGALYNDQNAAGPVTASATAPVTASATGNYTVTTPISSAATAVTNNTVTAQAAANAAVDNLNISANSTTGTTNIASGAANVADNSATADYALVSRQIAGSSSSTPATISSTGVGTFSYNGTSSSGNPLSNGSVSIQGNTDQVMAFGNEALGATAGAAGNVLNITGTDLTATGALANNQQNYDAVSANGSITALATLSGGGSSTAVADNSSLAVTGNGLSVQAASNAATNNLNVSATNTTGIASGSASDATSGAVAADYALENQQVSGYVGTTVTIASTGVGNFSSNVASTTTTTSVLSAGSVSIQGNTEQVLAFGNEALGSATGMSGNVLNITGTDLTATGALANNQQNYDAVSANGTITAQSILNGSGSNAVVQNAALNVTGNTLSVQAAGNAATNALNVAANAGFSGPAVAAATNTTTPSNTASADFVLNNNQTNQGGVTAQTGANNQIGVALNGTESGTSYNGVSNTAINVSNNNVTVSAYGNSATNTATLTALNSGPASMAVNSNQLNNGSILATASGIQIGVSTVAAGTGNNNVGSSLSIGGNSITSRAVGNSGITIIK